MRKILTTILLLAAATTVTRADISVRAELDSATLLMGRVTSLNVSLVKPASQPGRLAIPRDSMADGVEIVDLPQGDTIDLGNGIEEIKQRIVLQSFDSGMYMLKPIAFVGAGGDTIAQSGRPVLKVLPVNVDSLETIHDYADAQKMPRHLTDYLPDFLTDWGLWCLLGLALLIGGFFVWKRYFKDGRSLSLMPKKKVVPPYEEAVQRLNDLRSRHLCEKGLEKEYYTRLTDILRIYLERRFGINAMEMTSTQIMHALESNEQTRLPRRHMRQILEVADFVKFAAQRPLPDDNIKAFNSAMQFVEDTKPLPEPEDAEGKGESNAEGKSEGKSEDKHAKPDDNATR